MGLMGKRKDTEVSQNIVAGNIKKRIFTFSIHISLPSATKLRGKILFVKMALS